MIIRCYNPYGKLQIRLCYTYHIYTTDMYEYVFLQYHVKLHVAYRLQTNHMLHQITNDHELIPAISSPCWSHNSMFYCLPCWCQLPSAHCCFAIISHHVSASTSVHRQDLLYWRADYIRQGIKSSRMCSINSNQQLDERQHSFYQTSDPDQHEKATPASSDGVAPKPASDNLPNQEDELMNTCGDNWYSNQTNL